MCAGSLFSFHFFNFAGEDPPKDVPHTIDGKSILLSQKPETEEDLLDNLRNQVLLEAQYHTNLVGNIEARLASLRDQAPTSGPSPSLPSNTQKLSPGDEELPEEEQVEKIMNRVCEF